MRFECPGCGECTPDVVAEGGKPVYCTQCGRGFRFIYGFYHRYLYFVFNHPVLTYALLLIFALVLSTSFPGRLKLLYLAFFTVFYWTVFRWVQRSHKYLETLPTGPDAARAPPPFSPPPSPPLRPEPLGAPPAPKTRVPETPKGPRLSFFAVGAFILNLVVFPFALFAGFASLPAMNGLLLDFVHGTGGAGDFLEFLTELDLSNFRTVVAVYVFGVVLTSLFFLGLNILALSVVRSRKHRGKELVIWAFVFWFISTVLLGSQVVSGLHVITDWHAQERLVRSPGVKDQALELQVPAIQQWTLLHAWRSNASEKDQLFFFRRVLNRDGVQYDRRHEWIPRGMAIRLGADTIRDVARHWKESGPSTSPKLLSLADEFCLSVFEAMTQDSDPAIRSAARHALRRLNDLPFELPRSEKRMTGMILAQPRQSVHYMVNFGSGKSALAATLRLLRFDDRSHDPAWIGSLLRYRRDHREVADRLIELYQEADSDSTRRRIILAAASVEKRGVTPILIKGLKEEGEVRYRSLQALYRLFGRKRLPDDLYRVRQYYYRYRADSRSFGGSRYKNVHRATARGWIAFLRDRHPDLVDRQAGDGDY